MKCVLSGFNAKVFARAVQSLSRIGAELFVEGTHDGLSMRTVNNTKSAFALFKFLPEFFLDYQIEDVENDEFENKCKVSMKACLGIFKNMKQVEYCDIAIDSKNSKLMVQLRCRMDTVKTNYISIIDTETLQAVYTTEDVPNKMSASCKLFSEISSNFQPNEEEITLEASGDGLTVKNYVEGSEIDKRFMRSQLTLKADEFEKYSIKQETSITFCLREFRAFLGFAESANLQISVSFETGGRPAVFIVENFQKLEANLVTSTLNPEDVTMYECNTSQNRTITDIRNSIISQKRPSTSRSEQSSSSKKTKRVTTETESESDQLFTLENGNVPDSVDLVRAQPQCANPQSVLISRPNIESVHSGQDSAPLRGQSENRLLSSIENEIGRTTEDCSGIYVTFKHTGETDPPLDESVPKSPTSVRRTRARRVFKRCFEATINPTGTIRSNEILAKNSDTED